MEHLDRIRQWIAMNHVNEKGDAQTRDLVHGLREDRAEALRENESLDGENQALYNENAALQYTVDDMHRSGLSPGARYVVGWVVALLVVVSGITSLTMWFAGAGPLRAMRASIGAEEAPARAGPSWVGQIISFKAVGPPEIINAVTNRFKVMPASIDTGTGARLLVRYVDGPYSRLDGEAQRAQALAVARFLWRLPQRSKRTERITVRLERPIRAIGDVGLMRDEIFMPAELNGRQLGRSSEH